MSVFVTSDTHFFHNNIIKYCNRPFETVDDMNAALIENWNTTVAPTDTVYHLGDVSFGSVDNTITVLNRLNGKIHLIVGNHDPQKVKKLSRWSSVQEYLTMNWWDTRIVMFHYPIEEWDGKHRGSYHFHGHCHGKLDNVIPRRYDVGVDSNGLKPILAQSLISKEAK